MPIKVLAPNGATVEFPDGTASDVISGVMKGLAAPAQVPAAGSGDGPNEYANVATGGLIEGIPVVGPLMREGADRLGAGIRSVINDTPYADELKFVKEATGQLKERHPVVNTAAQITGAVAGTVPLVAAAPAAFGAGGGSFLARSAVSAGSGAVLSGADAAVRSGGDIGETAKGAAIGGVTGAAAPAIARGIGKGVSALRQMFAPGVDDAGRMATDRVSRAVFDDLGDGAPYSTRAADMGDEGMLLNLGPRSTGQAQALAVQPNAAKTTVRSAMDAQRAGTNRRLASDLDTALGKAQTPSAVEATIEAQRAAVRPLYERAVSGIDNLDPTDVVSGIDDAMRVAKGDALRRLREARSMLVRANPNAGQEGQPAELVERSARGLLNARGALDDIYGKLAGDSPQAAAAIAGVRSQVDDVLKTGVPGLADLDAQYAELARRSEALAGGGRVLDGGKTSIRPDELTAQRSAMTPEAQAMQRTGTRAEIDRLVGNKANDLVALKQAVKGDGDWNRAKLAQVFGKAEADKVLKAVDREAAFDDAYRRVIGNSETVARQQGLTEFPVSAPEGIGRGLSQSSAFGTLVARPLGWAADKVSAGAVTKARTKIAEDAARLLTKAGPERDAVVQALMLRRAQQGQIAASQPAIEDLVKAILLGGSQSASRPSASR